MRHQSTAVAIDDLTDMFIRSVQKLHNRGRDALDEYHRIHRKKTDYLIETLFNMLGVFSASSNAEEQMNMIKDILGEETEQIAEACENYRGRPAKRWHRGDTLKITTSLSFQSFIAEGFGLTDNTA